VILLKKQKKHTKKSKFEIRSLRILMEMASMLPTLEVINSNFPSRTLIIRESRVGNSYESGTHMENSTCSYERFLFVFFIWTALVVMTLFCQVVAKLI